MSTRRKRPVTRILYAVIMMVVAVAVISIALNLTMPLLLSDPEWTREAIKSRVNVQIPDDAVEIQWEGHPRGYGFYLALHFKAPPHSARSFASGICGSLIDGYDPYNAINVIQPVSYGHVMRYQGENAFRSFAYYSYSANASNMVSGNRCRSQDQAFGMRFIRLDASNPQLFDIKMDYAQFCVHGYYVKMPCEVNYTFDTQLFPDLPLLIRGLQNWSLEGEGFCDPTYFPTCAGDYVLDGFCLELDPIVFAQGSEWDYLIGASLRVRLDNQELPQAIVSQDGLITSRGKEADGTYFSYCYGYEPNVFPQAAALHSLTIEFVPLQGETISRSWEFWTGILDRSTSTPRD
jgi:hypothetical protein